MLSIDCVFSPFLKKLNYKELLVRPLIPNSQELPCVVVDK